MKIIITESQNKLLNEEFSPGIRRRIDLKELRGLLEQNLEAMVDMGTTPCDWGSVGDFIGDICDLLMQDFTDDYYHTVGETISPKTKDNLYYYFIDLFGKELNNLYNQECH